TIIKVKHVKQNKTKDAKSISVWAIGVYPVRDEYYSVGEKIVPNCYASVIRPKTSTHLTIKDLESNKCLLKVSFIGSPHGKISAIENTDDSVMEINIKDHIFNEPTVQLPNSDNTESESSAKRKRTEESHEHLPEMENADSTIDCEPEANNNSAKNTKP
ncbi:988_t:CDS:2, partial [Cetraspora pellucida]